MDQVLVCDVSDNGRLYYYCGYFKKGIPVNSNDYTKAMKIPYPKEAQALCDLINNQENSSFKYHVEEHAYG
jgi:hypothetical protein